MEDDTERRADTAVSEEAADRLKDRLESIKQRNLMDVVEEQRRREQRAEEFAFRSNERHNRGGIQ